MTTSILILSARLVRRFVPAIFLLGVSLTASANVVTFTGSDLNAGPTDPHPNASAAAASFAAAAAGIGPSSTITFESAPLGAFTSMTVAPGVTVNGVNTTVLNSPDYPPNPPLGGFNTTPGGSQYVDMEGGSLTFNFANPTQFFGVYLSGIQLYFFADTITFSDGTTQTINIPGTTDGSGSFDFVGFTDVGKSISSVTITPGTSAGGDFIGVDDVVYQTPVPEPSSLALMLTGFAGLGAGYRRMRAALS
jgi:hypothetical protein